jgi:hypothetical protein
MILVYANPDPENFRSQLVVVTYEVNDYSNGRPYSNLRPPGISALERRG